MASMRNLFLGWICLGWIACASPQVALPEILPSDQLAFVDSEHDYSTAAEFLERVGLVASQVRVKSIHRLSVEALESVDWDNQQSMSESPGPTLGIVFRGEVTHFGNGRRRSRVWELHGKAGTWEPQLSAPEWEEDHWAPFQTPDGLRTIEITVNIDPEVPEEAGMELARGMLNGWILPRQDWRRGPPVWIRVMLDDKAKNQNPRADWESGSPIMLRASAGWGGSGRSFQCYRNQDGHWIVISSGNWMV